MSLPIRTAILASAVCFFQPGENQGNEKRNANPLAAVAGSYYHGDGLGLNCSLTVEQEGRFSFVWSGCLGVHDTNSGGAKIVENHLILTPKKPKVQKGLMGLATDFVLIPWGARTYLVSEADHKVFCNEVNQGEEPREVAQGTVYLREGDWDKKVTGLPSAPKEWDHLLLKKPLNGEVIEVLDKLRARINLGSDDGVWKGMELWSVTQDFGLVEVVEAGAGAAVIVAKYVDEAKFSFRKGQRISSRLPKDDSE